MSLKNKSPKLLFSFLLTLSIIFSLSNLSTAQCKNISSPKLKNTPKIVYWTSKGKSFHYNKNCKTLKRSKQIYSGTLEEAKKKGKNDPCDICTK